MTKKRGRVVGLAVILIAGAGAGFARQIQQQPKLPSSVPGAPTLPGTENDNPFKDKMEAQRARMASNDRLKRIVADTDKLVQLSNELKVEVSKSTKDEMSLSVIRKAADIEKLAHDVKERMKN